MRILLCTNGAPYTTWAMDVGTTLAHQLAATVDVLVAVGGRWDEEARSMAQACAAKLTAEGIPVDCVERPGPLAEAAIQQAEHASYDLVVIGSRGRRGVTSLLLGSVARNVSGHVPASVLVIKGRPRELKQFLVCSAAGPASERTVLFAGQLAQALGASMTLLHVMSQLPLRIDAEPEDLQASAEELIHRQSLEGRHLARMMALLAEMEISARAVVRHGLVLDEVIAEAAEGRYDLLVTGAHVTPGLSAWLTDNLSEDILLSVALPVLIAR